MVGVVQGHPSAEDLRVHVVLVDHSLGSRNARHAHLRGAREGLLADVWSPQGVWGAAVTMGSRKTVFPTLRTTLAWCSTPWIFWRMAVVAWFGSTTQIREEDTGREEVFGEEQQNLGVPVLLTVGRPDPAHHHLHRLAGQPLVALRELQDLVGLHLLRLPHINVENHGGGEQAVAGVGDGQDLHSGGGTRTGMDVRRTSGGHQTDSQSHLWKWVSSCTR